MNTYVHVLNGRLRIKVPEVKRAPKKAAEVVQGLQELQGVSSVRANPTTGNVLVLFEPDIIDTQQIIQALHELGCLSNLHASIWQNASAQGARSKLSERLLQSVFETAIQQVIMALI